MQDYDLPSFTLSDAVNYEWDDTDGALNAVLASGSFPSGISISVDKTKINSNGGDRMQCKNNGSMIDCYSGAGGAGCITIGNISTGTFVAQ